MPLCCPLPTAPLPSRRVAASRGQCRWCGGGGSLHRPAAGAAITSMRGGCRRLVWLEAYADRPSPTADPAPGVWGEPRSLSLMEYGGGGGGSPFPPATIPIPPRSREVARPPQHGRGCAYTLRLTPFLLNGYPCLLCPCVVCFKFLQPKVIEGKKIDCALADPHLPRLLGGAPQLFTTKLVLLLSPGPHKGDSVRSHCVGSRSRW